MLIKEGFSKDTMLIEIRVEKFWGGTNVKTYEGTQQENTTSTI